MLSKSDTRGSAMSSIAGFMSCSFMKLIYQKFSCISVLSQAELGMQLKTQLNWNQNCIFTEWNELDVRSAMFGMAEFWVSYFESIGHFFCRFLMLSKSDTQNSAMSNIADFMSSSFHSVKMQFWSQLSWVFICIPSSAWLRIEMEENFNKSVS